MCGHPFIDAGASFRFGQAARYSIIYQPRPEEPTEGRRPEALEGRRTATGEAVAAAILRPSREPQDAAPRAAPQDEVHGTDFYPPDLISSMESLH
jgi:hypothetical protein